MIDLKTEDIIMNSSKVWGIAQKHKVKFSDHKTVEWKEFRDMLEIELLDRHPRYGWEHIKQAKKVLEAFSIKLHECTFHVLKDQPLIIDTPLDFYILIAPRIDQ